MVYSLVSLTTCSVNLLWYVNLLFIYCILLDNTEYFIVIVIVIVDNKLCFIVLYSGLSLISCKPLYQLKVTNHLLENIRKKLSQISYGLVQERRNSSALELSHRYVLIRKALQSVVFWVTTISIERNITWCMSIHYFRRKNLFANILGKQSTSDDATTRVEGGELIQSRLNTNVRLTGLKYTENRDLS